MKIVNLFLVILLLCCCAAVGVATAASRTDIVVDQDLLSVSVDQVLLEDIMQDLSDKTGLIFVMQVASDRKITVQFKDLPLIDGLRRLLSPDSFVIEYGPGAVKGKEAVKKVIVYGTDQKGAGRNIFRPQGVPEPASNVQPGLIQEAEADTADEAESDTDDEVEPENSVAYYSEQLTNQDPDVRENAVVDFVDDHGAKALPFIEKSMLSDDNSDVRAAAAGAIGGMQTKEGIAGLTRGLDDADDDVRMAVLEALGEIGGKEILPALKKALKDSNEDVREDAAALIEEIEE